MTKLRSISTALAVTVALALGSAPSALALEAASAPEPSPSPTAAGTTWALRPATEEGPDGRVSLRVKIDPGAEATEHVALTNFSARPATFAVYASDGTINADGSFDLIPTSEEPKDGGSWVAVGAVEGSVPRPGGGVLVEVPSEETVIIPLTITVPGNATPGDHPAGVVAEFVPGADSGMQFASRVGVRLHLRVSGDLVPALVPDGITTSYEPSWNPFAPGTLLVQYVVANDGNVRLGSNSEVTAAGPFGLAGASATSEQREILPGGEAVEAVELPVWPLFLTSGAITVTPSVVGEDEVDVPLRAAVAEYSTWTIPWAQVILLVLIIGVILLVRALRKRSKAKIQAQIDAAVAAATAATLGEPSVSAGDADAGAGAQTDAAAEPDADPVTEPADESVDDVSEDAGEPAPVER